MFCKSPAESQRYEARVGDRARSRDPEQVKTGGRIVAAIGRR